MLLKCGLLGEYRFTGKQGALNFVRQAGCIQFDPVDVCGKNAELTLQSRVKGFTKQTLYEFLYVDRKLLDYPDKNLSILPTEDWPYFERYRKAARESGKRFPELSGLEEQAKEWIRETGPDMILRRSTYRRKCCMRRIEAVCEAKTHTLTVKNIWYEEGIKSTKKFLTKLGGSIKRRRIF